MHKSIIFLLYQWELLKSLVHAFKKLPYIPLVDTRLEALAAAAASGIDSLHGWFALPPALEVWLALAEACSVTFLGFSLR